MRRRITCGGATNGPRLGGRKTGMCVITDVFTIHRYGIQKDGGSRELDVWRGGCGGGHLGTWAVRRPCGARARCPAARSCLPSFSSIDASHLPTLESYLTRVPRSPRPAWSCGPSTRPARSCCPALEPFRPSLPCRPAPSPPSS